MKPEILWDDLPTGWSDSLDIIFYGDPTGEERKEQVTDRFGTLARATRVECTYDVSTFILKLRLQERALTGDIRDILASDLGPLVAGKHVLVDITTLSHPLFLALVHALRQHAPSRVYCTYAEPDDYPKTYGPESDEYKSALSEGFHSASVLPTLVQEPAEGRQILVTLLGFEGDRLKSLLEREDYDYLLPIVGFPAYRPGWHLRTLKENHRHLPEGELPIRFAEAASPFEVRDVLLEVEQQNVGDQLKVAIIGTRPHALGALLAHIRSPTIRLIYDHPLEKKTRSMGVAALHVYDVSRDLGCAGP